jgi:hypothetical protein
MIDGGTPLRKEVPHLFQYFLCGNIFLPLESPFRRFANLAIDAIIGADLVRDEINPKRPPQSSGRNRTIKIAIVAHG